MLEAGKVSEANEEFGGYEHRKESARMAFSFRANGKAGA